jgi:hypothetical protein
MITAGNRSTARAEVSPLREGHGARPQPIHTVARCDGASRTGGRNGSERGSVGGYWWPYGCGLVSMHGGPGLACSSGRDCVVDLLAMIVWKRRSSSWHLIGMPFLGCVLVVASCSAHIGSETASALVVRSASIRTGGCRSELRRQRGCHRVDARTVRFDIKVDDQLKP